MGTTTRETIKEIVRSHLTEKGGLAFGQCLTAVGWVGGTLPELYERDGMIELSMADVAGGGIVVGAALMGKRPIYVIRYQGFNWFNAPLILNYACKSKELWGKSCPIFVRSIAMEGGIGPVAGSSHHSIYFRMPGVKIASPMTSCEYRDVYDRFMADDDVYYVSEHRKSFDFAGALENSLTENPDITLFPISATRFAAVAAREILEKEYQIKANVIHQVWLKPFEFKKEWQRSLAVSRLGGIILDDDYEGGVAACLAHTMMMQVNRPVHVMGLANRTAGFYPEVDNLPPTAEQIVSRVIDLKRNHGGG